jgi:hypothetical protein
MLWGIFVDITAFLFFLCLYSCDNEIRILRYSNATRGCFFFPFPFLTDGKIPRISPSPVYEFQYIVRSPGFELPPYQQKVIESRVAGWPRILHTWKASVLTKLDDDRATCTSGQCWLLNLNILKSLVQSPIWKSIYCKNKHASTLAVVWSYHTMHMKKLWRNKKNKS